MKKHTFLWAIIFCMAINNVIAQSPTVTKAEKLLVTLNKGLEILKTIPSKKKAKKADPDPAPASSPDVTTQPSTSSTPCKNYILFTNNSSLSLAVRIYTNKKGADINGFEIDETIDITISAGKSKKVSISTADNYKYKVYRGSTTGMFHSEGIVEVEECKTSEEEID